MAYLNFWIQSVFIACGLACGVLWVFDSKFQPYFFIIQGVTGCWQFFGALSAKIAGRGGIRKVRYLKFMIIYVLLLAITPYGTDLYSAAWIDKAQMVFLIVPAWALSLFYYALTATIAFPPKSTGDSFLPHTSF
jgi:hypothetical protein